MEPNGRRKLTLTERYAESATSDSAGWRREERPRQLLLTIESAARLLSLGRSTVYGLVSTGVLDSVKVGRARRVPYDALLRFIEQLPTAARCSCSALSLVQRRAA